MVTRTNVGGNGKAVEPNCDFANRFHPGPQTVKTYCGGEIETNAWRWPSVAAFVEECQYTPIQGWCWPVDDPRLGKPSACLTLYGSARGAFLVVADFATEGVAPAVVEACDVQSLARVVDDLQPLLKLWGVMR